ncbi:MAG: nucleotidyltransferase family protein [Candidatus Koribacter versatilis]|uniref:Nucleotidyltransferase family protein n=1 Tax=Candidatus Korobacter versatilis TaxID=658062 RepID=A0A932A690_9BACT|nr:nucleotidyltransferase family protein [Candidatus Koribacter versatilis]
MTRSPSFAGVILAAGESSRMGQDKALLRWDGGTFLSGAIEMLKAHVEFVIVVAGRNANALAPTVNSLAANLVQNHHPEHGQFSSLQVGLQEVLNRGRDAAIVALVDRPPANTKTVAHLKLAFLRVVEEDMWAVIPEHEGKHGHPIIAGRELMEACLRAPLHSNARDVEHAHQSKLVYVHVADANVIRNVDTPEQYQDLTRG